MKKKIILGSAISLIFLYFSFSGIEFSTFLDTFSTTNFIPVIIASLSSLVVFWVRAYRWKYLLALQKEDMSMMTMFSAVHIGAFANNVLPFRAGEFIRSVVVSKKENISVSSIVATILVERIADVFSLLTIAVAGFLLLPLPQSDHLEAVKNFALILIAIEVVAILFCLFMLWKREATLKFTERIFRILPQRFSARLSGILDSFIDGLEIIRDGRHFFTIVWTSFVIWVIGYGVILICLSSFDTGLSTIDFFMAGAAILVFSSFSVSIPSSPGFIGTYHFFTQQALVMFSIGEGTALGIATVIHLAMFVTPTLTGFIFSLKENVSIAEMQKRAETE